MNFSLIKRAVSAASLFTFVGLAAVATFSTQAEAAVHGAFRSYQDKPKLVGPAHLKTLSDQESKSFSGPHDKIKSSKVLPKTK
jgi:hypothetical protein